ncbi:Gfo/Idh/MocA family protein [Acidipropionibacterium jensenii]|uniref:Gfo/Idh/MocA family protein n=1 Tax=Acidipropionibacterium jensenii TaxID=1749 RepID=UPI00214C3DE1|nr:Gfo/Idh/MocA family oxidoreductase [Acidipropionibacterium jensenii]
MSDKRPAIGLVGAGGISRAHLPTLRELGSRVVIFSRSGAEALMSEQPVADRSTPERAGTRAPMEVARSLGQLLESVDVVDVVTPTPTHRDVVKAALEAGKDVICEKPLARTAADAQELAELAAARGLHLYPAHVVRYFPAYEALKDAVTSGRLGDPAVLRFIRSGSFPRRRWFADPEASGGIIMDQMIHDLDQARWLAGPVAEVSALRTGTTIGGDPVEVAHVMMSHTSGAVSQCSGVWGPPNLEFTTEYSVTGTHGTLDHSSRDGVQRPDPAADGPATGSLPTVDQAADPYALQLRDLLGAIAGGPQPRVSATDGVAAVQLAQAALASVRTGSSVPVPAVPIA